MVIDWPQAAWLVLTVLGIAAAARKGDGGVTIAATAIHTGILWWGGFFG